MGDFRNQAKKEAEKLSRDAVRQRIENGFTVFHFDFNPKLTRKNLTLGEAIRLLMRVTGTKVSFWRCPVRGLAMQYKELPRSTYSHDQGTTYRRLHFSTVPDEMRAKRELVLDLLIAGIGLYRGLPNKMFDHQVAVLRQLLTAPPSVDAEQWNALKGQLHDPIQPLLQTHQAELRHHLLGEQYPGPTGPVAITARLVPQHNAQR